MGAYNSKGEKKYILLENRIIELERKLLSLEKDLVTLTKRYHKDSPTNKVSNSQTSENSPEITDEQIEQIINAMKSKTDDMVPPNTPETSHIKNIKKDEHINCNLPSTRLGEIIWNRQRFPNKEIERDIRFYPHLSKNLK